MVEFYSLGIQYSLSRRCDLETNLIKSILCLNFSNVDNTITPNSIRTIITIILTVIMI